MAEGARLELQAQARDNKKKQKNNKNGK